MSGIFSDESSHYNQQSSDGNDVKQSLFNFMKPSTKQIGTTTIVIRPNNGIDLKLFVGQIPKEWDEEMITTFFSEYGEILESQIIRDPKTNTSKGCAFVKFASMTKAEEAKKQIEGKGITLPGLNNAIQIRWADGEDQRLGVDEHTIPKLFVGSIPKNAGEENLRDVFSEFGEIDELVLMKDPDGSSKGCAFIKFKTKEQALLAMRFLNGNVYIAGSDKPMEVRFAEKKAKTIAQTGGEQSNQNRGAGGYQATPSAATPINHAATSAPFYKYTTPEGMPYFLNPYTRHTQWEEPPPGSYVIPELPEQPYTVKSPLASMPKKPGPTGSNLFVFHLPGEWSEDDLYGYFKDFGTILSCRIMKDRQTNRSRGFGFVSYDNPNSANMAINKMNGFQAGSKRLKVEIKKGNEDEPNMGSYMPNTTKFNPY